MDSVIYDLKEIDKSETQPIQSSYDILFIAGGSDYRAYEVLRSAKSKSIFKNVILFDFKERKEGIDETLFKAYESYSDFDFKFIKCESSLKEPAKCIANLKSHQAQIKKAKKIAIDISCFTKPVFFLLLKYLKTNLNKTSVTIFYTEPKSYLFSDGIYKSYHSSTGPIEILEVPGFTGSSTKRKKILLVILLGFDGDLSREINEEVAPSSVVVINGFPGYSPKFKDISLISNEKLTGNNKNKIAYSRAGNPFETYNLLANIKRRCSDQTFINITPLGTKPMALGACLFALHNPDVRIIYPMPEKYENVTTDKCWKSWAYNLPLIMNTSS